MQKLSVTKQEIAVNILCSLTASFIFLFIVLILFKPKLKISPFICKGKFFDEETQDYFFIKLVNISLFSAYDINVELLQVDRYPTTNGQMNSRYISLPLVSSNISHIPGYRPSWWRKNAPYAIRVRTAHDLNSILTNDYKSVMIKVSLRHGLTGLVKVHSKEYTENDQVKNGKFEYGLKFGSLN